MSKETRREITLSTFFAGVFLFTTVLLSQALVSAGPHTLPTGLATACEEFTIGNVVGQSDVDVGLTVSSATWAVMGWDVGTILYHPAAISDDLTQWTTPFSNRAQFRYDVPPPLSGQTMRFAMSYNVAFLADENGSGPMDPTKHTVFGIAVADVCSAFTANITDWGGFTKTSNPDDSLTFSAFHLQHASGIAILELPDAGCFALVAKNSDFGNSLSVNMRSINLHLRQISTNARPCL